MATRILSSSAISSYTSTKSSTYSKKRSADEKDVSVHSLAMLSSDRWRIMCKHCLMLARTNSWIPKDYVYLEDILSVLRQNAAAAATTHPAPEAATAAPAAVAALPPAHAATTPAVPALPWWSDQPVPYKGGVIDWDQLDDDLDFPTAESEDEHECKVQPLDFSKPQSSKLNPMFHQSPGSECSIVGHKCDCENCTTICIHIESRPLPTPVRKRCRQAADTQLVVVEPSPLRPKYEATPANLDMPVEPPVAKRKTPPAVPAQATKKQKRSHPVAVSPPPVGIVASSNLVSLVENMADEAKMPLTARLEKTASSKKKGEKTGPAPESRLRKKSNPKGVPADITNDGDDDITIEIAKPAAPAKAKGSNQKKTKPKNSAVKKDKVPKTKKPVRPFSLNHRYYPLEQAQCYMMGRFPDTPGHKKKFVTNVSASMSLKFSTIMKQLLQEALDGKFLNKEMAVQRRDELLENSQKLAEALDSLPHQSPSQLALEDK